MPHVIGVDNFDEYRGVTDPRTGEHWRPDVCADVMNLDMFTDESMDFAFSSHLLEHIEDTEAALREWWRVIKPGGYLILYLPDKRHYPNIGQPGANPDHCHDFLPEDIEAHMAAVAPHWALEVNQTRSGGREYSFIQAYRKRSEGGQDRDAWRGGPLDDSQGRPRCLVIRYGAYGDMVQTSSVLPQLRQQGYHVTVNTTPRGHEVLRSDPNVDAFWLQDTDQVPNAELTEYWPALGAEFDRCINLSECTEGTLLAIPGRRNHAMSHAARHRLMNVNYVEFIHALAGLDHKPSPRFHPTEQERAEARQYRAKLGDRPVVLWSLAGSSVHKVWPWTGVVAAWLIEHTAAKVVFVGGEDCQVLEMAIAQELLEYFCGVPAETSHDMKLSEMLLALKAKLGENRIVCRSGSWSIRQSLAFVEQADVVVGPETGVLNAAGHLPMPKVVFLSHSSRENLTRDWINTTALEPVGLDCYPCHALHYGWEHCRQHEETGAAMCAALIEPERVFRPVRGYLQQAGARAA